MPRHHCIVRACVLAAGLLSATAAAGACQGDAPRASSGPSGAAVGATSFPSGTATFEKPSVSKSEQRKVMRDAARTAWNFVAANSSRSTGLVQATDSYQYVTIWDVGSTIASIYSARGLGLISGTQYRQRMDRLLGTLQRMPLFEKTAYNKAYDARTGEMVDRAQRRSRTGFGWSALDLGRFLIWMKILEENDPVAAPAVRGVIGRLKLDQVVRDGYLVGADLDGDRRQTYQEGRLGYEQYSAEGFALWGTRAARALDFAANGTPVSVYGYRILADKRGDDQLTSEPFIMMGMELGWTNPVWDEQARNVLGVQRARFKETGTMTMLSEDAVPDPPAYFYYYLLIRNGQQFVVRAPRGTVSSDYPRWVSTKAAFGWHALFPSDYTWQAIRKVRPAGVRGRGWGAGVYEASGRPVRSYNLNTAAIVLEAAYFAQRGACPLIRSSCR